MATLSSVLMSGGITATPSAASVSPSAGRSYGSFVHNFDQHILQSGGNYVNIPTRDGFYLAEESADNDAYLNLVASQHNAYIVPTHE